MNGSNRAWTMLALVLPAAALVSCGGGGGGGGGGGSSCELPSGATGTPGAYHIELRFQTTLTPDQETAFTDAAARLEQIVTSQPSSVQITWNADARKACGTPTSSLPDSEAIDGLVIFASVKDLGTGGVLAESGPCVLRGTSHLPAAAVMTFNSQYLDKLSVDNLHKTVLHEMLHTLGFGTMWGPTTSQTGFGCGLVSALGHSFTGTYAVAAAKADNGAPASWKTVPVEDCVSVPGTCGVGTKDVHWRWAVFHDSSANTTELMTGWIIEGTEPLSAASVASLQDLGYSVDLTKADPYTLPPTTSSSAALEVVPAGGIWLGDDVRKVPPVEVPED